VRADISNRAFTEALMRNDPLKYAIVLALSLMLGGAETFAAATAPSMPGATGAREAATTITGRIQPGATAIHPVPFERGREYRVRVMAISPNSALALQLFSPGGRELDRDANATRVAEVATIPSGRGRYEVEVTMARCPTETCAYRLVVLSR
jgi:hypothetical protein